MKHAIDTRWIPLGTPGFEGLLALPPAGHGPGLLLWQEIFGVNAHIRRVAEQYALAGFTVLAPDVFWRSQPRLELGYDAEAVARGRTLKAACTAQTLRADLDAAAAALRALPHTRGSGIGSVGYCFGGQLAFLSAAWCGTRAAVSYYGGGIEDQLAHAPAVQGDLLLHYAGEDAHIPAPAVQRVREATAKPGSACHVYPGTQHGFNCWERASYAPGAAALALGRSLQFLAERLF